MNAPAFVKQLADQLKAQQIDAVQDGPDLRWAHRVMERFRRGQHVKSATLQMAREALERRGGTNAKQ